MSLKDQLRKDMFQATKDGDTSRSDILKMAIATIKNEQIAKEEELDDATVIKILRKEAKKIEDSITQFTQMQRSDLVEKEKSQLDVINAYLPALMDISKVEETVKTVIEKTAAKDIRDMGKVMGMAMKELDGQADGNTVREIVQKLLS
jgi:uncharacterized protein YqeY